MGIFSNLTFPEDESSIGKWLLNNKNVVIAELKELYEFCLDNCGPDDEINTLPAKELYERASLDILSCKDEIQDYYSEIEYWEKLIEKDRGKDKEIRKQFKVVK